jgi:hypothetical protein
MAAEADADTLQKHMAGTYHNLRLGVGVVGLTLPIALWLGGMIFDREALRSSMSAYYYSDAMRNTFVGALITIGVILYLYKGFSTKENVALNLAGFFAVAVALIPTHPADTDGPLLTAHRVAAVLFFACIAYVAIFRASDTLSLIRDTDDAERLRIVYRSLGIAMGLLPLIAVILGTWDAALKSVVVFIVEAFAVWTFGIFWLVKSAELKATDAQRLALEGKLQAAEQTSVPSPTPGRLVQIAP